MGGYVQALIVVTGWIIQFSILFIGFAIFFGYSFMPRNRWRINVRTRRLRQMPKWWLRLWRVHMDSISLQERRVLLAGCGIRWLPEVYLAYRRCLIFSSIVIGLVSYILEQQGYLSTFLFWNGFFLVTLLVAAIYFDRIGLQSLKRYRTDRIRSEIVAVSTQLLYYTGSRLHLHGKLMKCLPLTKHIRAELGMLLNEWYHDADSALRRFKERLATEEAYGFTETIRSLRMNESQDIYDLLREVVLDYKAQIVLAKDGRKETTSYLLFVLAGIPILYTFQIFLYPWVQEAAKLFDALNP